MRLIDADAIGIGKAKREAFTVPEYADGWNSAIEIIDKAPTIDIVRPTRSQFKRMAVQLGYEPVVHCKDCKYWQDNNDGYPHEECRWGHGETPDANDFCSYGERKTNGNEDRA